MEVAVSRGGVQGGGGLQPGGGGVDVAFKKLVFQFLGAGAPKNLKHSFKVGTSPYVASHLLTYFYATPKKSNKHSSPK